MSLSLLTPPTVEPISVQEAKQHVRVFINADDCYIGDLITAARIKWEVETGYHLSEAEYSYTTKAATEIELPLRPVHSVESVGDLAAEDYELAVDAVTGRGILTLLADVEGDLAITFKVGFANPETDEEDEGQAPHPTPALIKLALLSMVAHWYNTRESYAAGSEFKSVPGLYTTAVRNYRIA